MNAAQSAMQRLPRSAGVPTRSNVVSASSAESSDSLRQVRCLLRVGTPALQRHFDFDVWARNPHCSHVGSYSESRSDRLWKEYISVFAGFDDLTLARWMCQTLGQLSTRSWRLSHPLIGAYRLAAQLGHDRQIWFKRMATPPADYLEAGCCRAPLLPL